MSWGWYQGMLVVNGQKISVREITRIREGKRWFGYPAFIGTILLAVYVGFQVGSWWGLGLGLLSLYLSWKLLDLMQPFVLHIFMEPNRVISISGTMQSIDALRRSIHDAKVHAAFEEQQAS